MISPLLTILVNVCLLDYSYPNGCEMVLIYVFLMVYDAEHLSILAAYTSSMKKYVFKISAHFLIALFVFLMSRGKSVLYVWVKVSFLICISS